MRGAKQQRVTIILDISLLAHLAGEFNLDELLTLAERSGADVLHLHRHHDLLQVRAELEGEVADGQQLAALEEVHAAERDARLERCEVVVLK